jgi:hypothetical protein
MAVLGVGDPDPHWTCVVGVTENAIEFFDSSMYPSEKRAKTTLPKDATVASVAKDGCHVAPHLYQ